MFRVFFVVKGHAQGQLWVQLTTIFHNTKTNQPENKFMKFGMVLSMWSVFLKTIVSK